MDKIKKLQAMLPQTAEAALIRDPANRFYLTGMKSSAGTVVVTRTHAWLIIDFRYLEEAERKVKNCTVLEEKELYAQIRALLVQHGISALSVHAGLTSLAECRRLEASLEGIVLDKSDALAAVMEGLRMTKDEEEIACHRRAQGITDQTFAHICGVIRPGMTELAVAQEIGTHLTALGSDDRTFYQMWEDSRLCRW